MGIGMVMMASALPVREAAEAGKGPGRMARACAPLRTGGAGCRREPVEWQFERFALVTGQEWLFAGRDVRSLKGAIV